MFRPKTWVLWFVAVPLYWWCALRLLFWLSPVMWDGSGPSATFYWSYGEKPSPSPTAQEYDQNLGIRREFLYPYWVGASIITFVGCCLTPWTIRPRGARSSRPILVAATMTLFLLLMVGALSDLGTAFHIWTGPRIYNDTRALLFVLFKVMLPMSLLAGVLTLTARRLNSSPP